MKANKKIFANAQIDLKYIISQMMYNKKTVWRGFIE